MANEALEHRRPAPTIAGMSRGLAGGTWSGYPADHLSSAGPTGIATFVGALLAFTAVVTASSPAAEGRDESPVPNREIPLAVPGSEAWKPLFFRSIQRHTSYEIGMDPAGRPAYRAVSDCGASAMHLALPEDLDLALTPRLAWRWRIEQGLDIEFEKTKSGDDFAARVYLLFEFDSKSAGPLERLEHALGRRLFGLEIPGQTLNFVWASRAEVGEVWTSPYHAHARLIAVASRSAEASRGGWRQTTVDLSDSARRLFDPPPAGRPYALALMVDADDVCARAVAWFSDFRLLGPVPTRPLGANTALPASGAAKIP